MRGAGGGACANGAWSCRMRARQPCATGLRRRLQSWTPSAIETTSELVEADFRITIEPGLETGLRVRSQVMADKPVTIRRERIRATDLPAPGRRYGAAQCGASIRDGPGGLARRFRGPT